MPFKSEKQRRFMWSEHPEIAKRWAHEYPESNKNLPMYAQKSKGENSEGVSAAAQETKKAHYELLQRVLEPFRKASESVLKEVNVPRSTKPVAAGDEHVTAKRDALGSNRDKTTYPESAGAGKCQQKQQRPDVLSVFNLHAGQGRKADLGDSQKTAQARQLQAILTKFAAVIRLGRETSKRLQREYDPRLLSGIDGQKLQQQAQREAQLRMFSATPRPLGEQQNQPIATYAGTQPKQQQAQPAKPPANVTSNKLMGNFIGRAGALNSKNGVPTAEQDVTGSAAFGVNQA